jgi:hypothetical protein
MRVFRLAAALTALCWLGVIRPAAAQEHAPPETHADSTAQHGEEEHHAAPHHHKNDLGVFVGITRNNNHDTISFTLGLDYIRKFGPNLEWGVGAVPEYVFADHAELVIPLMLYRGFGDLFLWTGGGLGLRFGGDDEHDDDYGRALAKRTEDDPDSHDEESEDGTQSTFLFRIGAGYSFVLPQNWYITPTFSFDFGGHRNRFGVLGVTFAKGF